MKKGFSFLIFICLVLVFNSASYATKQALDEIKKERDEINAKVRNTESELSAIQSQIYQARLSILDLDERLTIANDNLDVISNDVSVTETLYNKTQTELEAAQSEHDRQFEAYKKRVRVMYEYGSLSYLSILLQTTSMSEFLTQLEYLNAIAKHDNEMVRKLDASEEDLRNRREDVDRQLNTLEELRFRQIAVKDEIEATLAEQNVLVVALLEDEANAEFQLAVEQEDARIAQESYEKAKKEDDARKAAEAAARAAQSVRIAANYNGTMNWPVPQFSRITDQYGSRIHPIKGTSEFHKGLDIAAPMNSDIIAADGGRVVTAERNWSYGNYIVIDHGGVSTLYAHASKLLVSEGQTVSKGEVIAKVGSTGVSTGPHLHFEVHVGGAHTSPKAYLNY